MHTFRPWMWQENLKYLKNASQTMYYLEDGKKHWQMLNMRNVHCRTWNMARNLKRVKMRHKHCITWNMAGSIEKHEKRKKHALWPGYVQKTEKRGKWEMNTLGPGLWQEILKTRKMRNAHSRTWILRRKLQNLKNKNSTLYDLEYDKKKNVEKQKCTL